MNKHQFDILVVGFIVVLLIILIAITIGFGGNNSNDCAEAVAAAEEVIAVDDQLLTAASDAFTAAGMGMSPARHARKIERLVPERIDALDTYEDASKDCDIDKP